MNALRRLLGLSPLRSGFATACDLDKILELLLAYKTDKITIKASGMGDNAGHGVFTTSQRIEKGEILTLYPGLVFPVPKHVLQSEEGINMHNNDMKIGSELLAERISQSYVITSQYGGFIDGDHKDHPLFSANKGTGSATHIADASYEGYNELISCGHLVNHPNQHVSPNVDVIHFKWSEVLQASLDKMKMDNNHNRGVDDDNNRDGEAEDSLILSTEHVRCLKSRILRINRLFENEVWYYNNFAPDTSKKLIPSYHSSSTFSRYHDVAAEADADDQVGATKEGGGRGGGVVEYDRRNELYFDLLVGVALVACEDIDQHDTELLLDYQLSHQAASKLDWYHPVQ